MYDQNRFQGIAMCGISGILNFGGQPVAPREIVTMTDALAHRGRDNAAVVLGGAERARLSTYPGVALGHRRLSVIDLAPHSAQPMASEDERNWIVYNGELYNYRELRRELMGLGYAFGTESDTEVVLVAYQAWGEACLARFNGMFAFAIWSEASQSLFCARDPIGIKPFYFTRDEQSFKFASEARALVAGKTPALDSQSVTCYFLSMYVPRELSIFAGVRKLLPGHCMRVERSGKTEIRSYWNLPATGTRNISAEDAAVELQSILDKAVAAQLQSDVPVGALLSGGFDSGMIVASAAQHTQSLHTYSVGFDDGRQFNELPIAKALAARYGTIHHERVIRSDEVMDMLDKAIACMSEPIADSAMVPTYCLSQMAAEDGVKVLLSGTGGDEVFGGYSRYVGASRQRRLFYCVPRGIRHALGRTLFRDGPLGARLRHPALDMMLYTGGSPKLAGQLLSGRGGLNVFFETLAQDIFPPPVAGTPGLYENMLFDLQVYLPDELLMLLDQLTMAHTVEGRVPLLDIDLITASYSLPPALHASQHQAETRKLMRRMARGKLDERTFSARKQGFSGPMRYWIESNRYRFRERIMTMENVDMLNGIRLDHLWHAGAEQDPYWAGEVFSLYCFATWYQAHAAG